MATEIRNLDSFALKGAMMQGIEDTLTEAIEVDFLAADNGVKHAFFRSIEMEKIDVVHYGIMNKLIYNSFERWT